MKQCSKCKEVKGFEEFAKDKYVKDGHKGHCKQCCKEHRDKTKDKISKRMKVYRENNKEKTSEYHKIYHEQNRDKRNTKERERYQNKKKSINEQHREYYQQNKEQFLQRQRKYVQTERGRDVRYKVSVKRRSYNHKVRFYPHERTQILERDNYTCQECGITVHDRRTGDWNTHDKAHIDHIKPISKGGDSTPQNLQTLCRTCNLSKSNKMTG